TLHHPQNRFNSITITILAYIKPFIDAVFGDRSIVCSGRKLSQTVVEASFTTAFSASSPVGAHKKSAASFSGRGLDCGSAMVVLAVRLLWFWEENTKKRPHSCRVRPCGRLAVRVRSALSCDRPRQIRCATLRKIRPRCIPSRRFCCVR